MDRLAEVGSENQELQSEDLDSKTEEGSVDTTAVKSTVTEDDVPKSLSFDTNYVIHDKTRQELRTLLKENPNGIWAADLLEKYKARFNKELNIESQGFSTTMDMTNLQDRFQGERPNQYSYSLLHDAQSTAIVQKNKKQDDNIPEEVKDNVETLLQKNPNGIQANCFQRTYDSQFPQRLETKEYGHDNVDTFLWALYNKQVRLSYSEGEIIVFPLVDMAPSPPSPPGNAAVPRGRFDFSRINSVEIPQNVVQMGEELPLMVYPEAMMLREHILVQPGEIYTPGRFYIQIYGKKYSRALDQMMNEMQEFYQIRSNSLRVNNVHQGLYIAATYNGEWHRGRVHTIQSREVKVFYVDFGTVGMCQIKELCYLHNDFSTLPPQAILASLYNIKPCRGATVWSKRASYHFLKLMPEKINATVNAFDAEKKSMEVCLVDTTGEEDIHINDTLVQEKLAEFIVPPPPLAIEAAPTSHQMEMVAIKQEVSVEMEPFAIVPPPPGFSASGQHQVDPVDLRDKKATEMLLRKMVDKLGANHVMEVVMSRATENSSARESPASSMSLSLTPVNEQPSIMERGRRDFMIPLSQVLENQMMKYPQPPTVALKKKPEVVTFESDSDSSEEIQMAFPVTTSPKTQKERKYIADIDLGGIHIHLLNVDRNPLLLTTEVARFIVRCNDMLDLLNRLVDFPIPYVTLRRQAQPQLFRQLKEKYLDWVISTSKGKKTVHLLPLTHLSSILKHLRIDNAAIMRNIRHFLEHFRPDADCWFVTKN